MQIWRMKTDGSDQEQVTNDEYNNWFAHPSPDGKWIVFLSYEKDVQGHPANKDVMLKTYACRWRRNSSTCKIFRRTGNNQRSFMVT